jgi:hypothetical protein
MHRQSSLEISHQEMAGGREGRRVAVYELDDAVHPFEQG